MSQQLYIQHTLTSNAEVPTKNASWGRNCTDFLIPHQMQMCECVYVVQQYYANLGKYEAPTKCTHRSHKPERLSTTFQLETRRQQTALHNFLQLLHPAVLTLLLPHNFLNCTKLLCWMQQCCPSVRPPAVLGAAGGFYICTQPLSNGSLPLITCQTMHLNQPLNVCSRKPPPEISKACA